MNDSRRSISPPQPYTTVYIRDGRVIVDLMLMGDHNAGKTSIIGRFVDGIFDNPYYWTGCSFHVKNVWMDNSEVTIRLWDTAGDERYRGSGRSSYRHCHGVMIVYDVTNVSSFDNINKVWLRNIKENGSNDFVVVIVGTKCDLPGRQVDYVTAKNFADSLNIPLIETSSLTGYGIDRAVMSAAVMAVDKITQNASSICELEYKNKHRETDNGCQVS